MPLNDHHQTYLAANGVDVDVALEAGVRSDPNGITFPWTSPDGRIVEQHRPDNPGEGAKYLWTKGEPLVIWVHPRMTQELTRTGPVVIVEGTKQYLAAVSHAPAETLIVGMVGCYGWRQRDSLAGPDLKLIPWAGRDITLIFDADRTSNPDVYDAAAGLAVDLEHRGANTINYGTVPGGGKFGLDDAVVEYGPQVVARIIDKATPKPGRRPKPAQDASDDSQVDMAQVVDALITGHDLAVDKSGRVLMYADGVYAPDRTGFVNAVGDILGAQYRDSHKKSAETLTAARLHRDARIIPEPHEVTSPLISVRNGLLDPLTGELHPHTPDHLSTVQFPVTWNPQATCPTFDRWLDEVTDGRSNDLLEALSGVLDPLWRMQWKAILTLGPTRSGKSTIGRLIENTVGRNNTAAKTLDAVSHDKFAAADLYGKVLNFASELKSGHVDDVKDFMRLTGDDPFDAQHKYGQPFKFRNRAIFLFATNSVPTVTEPSGAYLARIRAYTFPNSYEGREDPTLEAQMMLELPGVLVRLVEAFQRIVTRGNYIVDDTSSLANAEFAQRSDSVTLFLSRCVESIEGETVSLTEMWDTYKTWIEHEERKGMLGKQRFNESLRSKLTERRAGRQVWANVKIRPSSEWDEDRPGPFGLFRFDSPSRETKKTLKKPSREGEVEPNSPNSPKPSGETFSGVIDLGPLL